MRFLFGLASVCINLLMAMTMALAQTPDAAPSMSVDTVDMLAFEPTREEAVLEAYIDGVIAAHMRERDIPGISLSVVQSGRVLFAKGYGYADAAEKTQVSGQNTLFRIGSVSKTFVWTSVMMLVERGQINLEADVNLYLKGLQIPETFSAPITMNDLMAHRGGFEDTLALFTVNDSSPLSLTEALEAHMPKRVYPPGTRTSYSNWGAALAAKIVEDVSGVSYAEFMQSEILTPLGMANTTLEGPTIMDAQLRAHLAEGQRIENRWPVTAEYMEIGPYTPVGGIAATAEDMAHWMLLHLGGGDYDGVRLLSQQTHDQMWSRAFKDRAVGADIAHGFMSKSYLGYKTYSHGGATSAFFTNMVLVPELGLGIYVSQNTTADLTLISELSDLIIDRLAPPQRISVNRDKGAMQAEIAKDYAGTYLQNRRSFSTFEKLFAANAVVKVTYDEAGALLITSDNTTTRMLPHDSVVDVFQGRYGHRVVFGRNEHGVVTHMSGSSGAHSFEKTGLFTGPGIFTYSLGVAFIFGLTTWLGAWRRHGNQAFAQARTTIGFSLGLGGFVAGGLVFIFVGALMWAVTVLSNASAADLLNYPPAAVTVLRVIAAVLFIAAFAMLMSLWPAWTASGWGVWRKLHHTAFTVALLVLAVALVQWKVVFSATV